MPRDEMPKVQRWIDLLAALLRRRYHASFEELRREVPGYLGGEAESVRRKFERDKDELRAFGVPIRTVKNEAGETAGYRLAARDFYLPYLSVLQDGAPTAPAMVDRDGFRALTRLTFEAEELAAVVEAARRILQLGDPVLAGHVRSAMRKLGADLPIDAAVREEAAVLYAAAPALQPDPAAFERLSDALARRKCVTFDYFSIGSGETTRRTVEPYGLFFLSQHWYLAAGAPGEAVVKNYRLNRMARVAVNPARPGSADYAIPAGFRLREHARSRHAWELGDSDALEVTVDFHDGVGAAVIAAELGEAVEGSATRRRFLVRRLDTFVRWLLPLGPAATPAGPEALLEEYGRQRDETLALYAEVGA
ncbi:MAG TPA: WYL domain-containing protein [Gemmatimonadales bacterium]|nr:WYL domain-containing protein [Gemmatimonadales bacterium]